MKKLLFIGFALFIALTLVLGLSSCGESEPVDDEKPGETVDKGDENTDEETKDKATLTTETLSLDGENISGKFPYATEIFNFVNDIKVTNNSPWVVSTDSFGMQIVATKTVPLAEGDNTFYIHVTNPDQTVSTYTVNIYRNHLYTVSFNVNGGTSVAAQYVEEGCLAEEPTTSRIGYTFDSCDFSFDTPITSNITVNARFDVAEEMANFEFTSTATTCTVTGIKDKSVTEIIVPDYVTEIGNKAFYKCTSLTSVEIGDSVTTIGERAFYKCTSLTSVVIPDSVTTIGEHAFYECYSLTSVVIPDSVTTIGAYAFGECNKLVEVINKSSLNITVGSSGNGLVAYYAKEVHSGESKIVNYNDYLFYTYNGANYLLGYVGTDTELTLPESYNGEKYEIYQYAFRTCTSLTSVVIPDSVTTIGDKAFRHCDSLTSVVIGDSVTTIGYNAFYNCNSLTSVVIGDSVTTIGEDAFYLCYKLVEVINKSSLNITAGSEDNGYVAYYAKEVHSGESKIVNQNGYLFYTYDGVNYLLGYAGTDTELTLPESYNGENYEIYQYAFYKCTNLTSVVIPDSVTTIGSDAFSSCTSLTSVVIGDSVTTIGSSAFAWCDSLTSIKYRGTEAQWKKILKVPGWNSFNGSYTITYNYSEN